jgi:hypothetical protein
MSWIQTEVWYGGGHQAYTRRHHWIDGRVTKAILHEEHEAACDAYTRHSGPPVVKVRVVRKLDAADHAALVRQFRYLKARNLIMLKRLARTPVRKGALKRCST